jgi:hypothetical protein
MNSFVFIREIKPVNEMTREELIDALVDEMISYLWNEDRDTDFIDHDHEVLKSYLRDGFVGFSKMSDEDLRDEYERAFGANDDAEYEDER